MSFFSSTPPPPGSGSKPPRTITSPDDEIDEQKLSPREAGRLMREKRPAVDLSPRSTEEGDKMALQSLIEEWLDLECASGGSMPHV
jgi:hypothetical protein